MPGSSTGFRANNCPGSVEVQDAHSAPVAFLQQPDAPAACRVRERGHTVSVELNIHADITPESVKLHQPGLVIAPFLKRAVPEDVWAASVAGCALRIDR